MSSKESSSQPSEDGESSRAQMGSIRFPLPVAVDMLQIVLALHDMTLTHKDLKPQNILVSERLGDSHTRG